MLTIAIQGSFADAKAHIQKANKRGDAIELRFDLLDDLHHASKLKKLCSLPVIFTLRKKSQGGKFLGSEREREEKILELLSHGADYVDLEYDCNPAFVQKVRHHFPDTKIICSFHNFDKTPENLEALLSEMKKMRAAIYKVATFANSSLDSLRMLAFVKKHDHVAGMCMGEHGVITRILGPIVNNWFTYAAIGEETAPGQLDVNTLEKTYHFSHLNRQTAIYALIGDPVDQSVGHLTHNLIYKKLKLDAVYVKFVIKPAEVSEFFRLMKNLPFHGFSVTMPLKEEVGAYLDTIDPKAKSIGAVNTLALKDKKWKGFNTDAAGALDAIEGRGKVAGKKIVILGAGGAARALAFESIQRGGKVLILNRTWAKAKKLAEQLGCEGSSFEEWDMLPFDILMNATPIGMADQSFETLVPKEVIPSSAIVFDAVISPKETSLLSEAKSQGCRVVHGYEMFSRQAIKQIEIWFSQSFDQEDLLHAIEGMS